MKAIIVGMGVQGNKRKKFLGKDFIFSVDKFKKAEQLRQSKHEAELKEQKFINWFISLFSINIP